MNIFFPTLVGLKIYYTFVNTNPLVLFSFTVWLFVAMIFWGNHYDDDDADADGKSSSSTYVRADSAAEEWS